MDLAVADREIGPVFVKILMKAGYCVFAVSGFLVLITYLFTVIDGGWGALIEGSNPFTRVGVKNWTITLLVLMPGPLIILVARVLADHKSPKD